MKKLKDIEIMKKVYKLLNEIELICDTLYNCGIISYRTYADLRTRTLCVEKELGKYTYSESPQGLSFSSNEKYVNDHINLADTEILIGELRRRGIDIKK